MLYKQCAYIEKNKFICKCGKNFTYNTQLLEHQNMCVTTFVPKLVIMEQHMNHLILEEEEEMMEASDTELAAMYPPKDKITRGDIIAAAQKKSKKGKK